MSCELLLADYPWINIDFLKDVLRNNLSNLSTINVCDFTIKPALKPGENYGSQIIRAHVNYSLSDDFESSTPIPYDDSLKMHTISLIIKASLGAKLVRSVNVFEKEIFMFKEIIPKVENVLKDAGIITNISARCMQTSLDLSYLVFEDLTVNGYKNVNRTLGLDYDHLKLVLCKLAKWHAASAILVEENPDLRRLYEKPHVNPNGSPKYRDLFENAASACAEVFQNVAGFEHISRKLIQIKEKVFERCCAVCTRDDTEFNVLTHGDLWANNIMFVYDECDRPNDALLVDFQVGFWGSPILDLTHFLFTSSHASVKDLEWDRLFHYYYNELASVLLQLNYRSPIPTYEDILTQISKKSVYSAIFSIFAVTLRVWDDVQDTSAVIRFLGTTEEDRIYRIGLISSPKAQLLLENLLQYFDKKGFLD